MIDFRYHLVSVIAIFFALAAGIVLGAGPLGERVDEDLPGQLSAMRDENQTLRDDLEASQADLADQEEFLGAVAPRLVGDALRGERVAVVSLPGADSDIVTSVQESLTRAGATAELVVQIEPTWTDPDSEKVLDTLASELVASGTELSEEGDGYRRGATVLAAALLAAPTDGSGPSAETVDTAAVTAYEEAGLISLTSDASAAPSLAVVVAGGVSGDDADDRVARLVTLGSELEAGGSGAVATGPPATAEAGAVLGAIRADGDIAEALSTVDSINLASSTVSLVYAVAEQAEGAAGHYGVVGETDGLLPENALEQTQGEASPGGDG